MIYTAGSVMDRAASMLNDTAKTLYTYTVQLPYLKSAHQMLEQEGNIHGVPLNLISEYESTVAAGDIALSLPTSFFLPLSLMERTSGSTLETDYYPMQEVANVLDLRLEPTNILQYWDWRHNCVNFIGATVDRQVRMFYWRQLTAPNSDGSIIAQAGADNYLAFKTAALCARYIMADYERADSLDIQAAMSLDQLMTLLTKNTQGIRVRRLPFRRGR